MISIDEAVDIYKQIQNELIPSQFSSLDDHQIEEIIRAQEQEEELVLNASTLANKTIVCPICIKANLVQEKNFIYCQNFQINSCNFILDCSKINRMSLDELGRRLNESIKQHSCNETPIFMFNNSDMKSFDLMLICDSCGHLQSLV